jgi:chromosomal replication initiator protein
VPRGPSACRRGALHADRKIRNLMAERRSIYNQVTELTNRIKAG